MSNETTNLKLHKWDTTNSDDLKEKFDIEKSLNENWDKIDEAIKSLQDKANDWEIVKELTLEEEIKQWDIDLGGDYKEIDVRFDFEASSADATRPGELMFRINDTKNYGTGIGINVSTYAHFVIKSIVKAGRIFSFHEGTTNTSSMPNLATVNTREYSSYVEANSINKFRIYAYGGNITAGSKITIYGRK